MKVLYYTFPYLLDCDFPLIQEMQKRNVDFSVIIDIPPYFRKSTLINIENPIKKSKILKASEYAEFRLYADFFDINRVYVINRLSKHKFALSNLFLNMQVFKFILKNKFKILHLTFFPNFPDILLYFVRKRILLTVHDPFLHTGEVSLSHSLLRKMGFKMIHNFLILNKSQKDEFILKNKLQEKKVFVSRLGVYSNLKNCAIETKKGESPYILFFGRISPYKGIEYLLEAMLRIHSTCPNLKLIIAGGGLIYFDKRKYEKLDYIDIRNRYHTTKELATLICNSEFVVCPYTDATQSGVVMSSFAFCKPVIATNVGGLSESVIENETGLLVAPKNIDDLSRAIVLLYDDEELREKMKKNIELEYWKSGKSSWFYLSCQISSIYNDLCI